MRWKSCGLGASSAGQCRPLSSLLCPLSLFLSFLSRESVQPSILFCSCLLVVLFPPLAITALGSLWSSFFGMSESENRGNIYVFFSLFSLGFDPKSACEYGGRSGMDGMGGGWATRSTESRGTRKRK